MRDGSRHREMHKWRTRIPLADKLYARLGLGASPRRRFLAWPFRRAGKWAITASMSLAFLAKKSWHTATLKVRARIARRVLPRLPR